MQDKLRRFSKALFGRSALGAGILRYLGVVAIYLCRSLKSAGATAGPLGLTPFQDALCVVQRPGGIDQHAASRPDRASAGKLKAIRRAVSQPYFGEGAAYANVSNAISRRCRRACAYSGGYRWRLGLMPGGRWPWRFTPLPCQTSRSRAAGSGCGDDRSPSTLKAGNSAMSIRNAARTPGYRLRSTACEKRPCGAVVRRRGWRVR